MENNEEGISALKDEIAHLNKRLNHIEQLLKQHNAAKQSSGHNVWVLVPVVAIIMWGLTQIF
ncbi:hypothetical protein GCM10011391_13240 [Pullulanibacillus camelliae]|uniref:Uncharacterized protein n=1 Tax=Pullulanibacillus camelliae TaxID=1707096 RepID=A0A8J2VU94_9BACL|nr:hypothetical protein [Pullulanibacillus camelliae]GGE35818.1 hypothetical protein GCM10011391_13240 [Pullulanibacillus camelliae]